MDLPKPSRTFDITVNGEKSTITMSYGLFNEVMKVIPSPAQVNELLITNPFLRDFVIRRMLTGNKPVASDDDLIDAFDLDIEIDELDDLVSWVGEHVLHFFMKSAEKTAKIGEKYQETVQELTRLSQSLPGAEN